VRLVRSRGTAAFDTGFAAVACMAPDTTKHPFATGLSCAGCCFRRRLLSPSRPNIGPPLCLSPAAATTSKSPDHSPLHPTRHPSGARSASPCRAVQALSPSPDSAAAASLPPKNPPLGAHFGGGKPRGVCGWAISEKCHVGFLHVTDRPGGGPGAGNGTHPCQALS